MVLLFSILPFINTANGISRSLSFDNEIVAIWVKIVYFLHEILNL